MKFNKFKKKFSDRLRKAPHTAESEEVKKKDPRGPQCFECSGFGHIRTECANLKKQKGKPLMKLSAMSLRRKKKLLRKKNSWPLWPHMKKMRILSPTTLRIVKKKICSQPINFNMYNS
jgi:hypothetical protein